MNESLVDSAMYKIKVIKNKPQNRNSYTSMLRALIPLYVFCSLNTGANYTRYSTICSQFVALPISVEYCFPACKEGYKSVAIRACLYGWRVGCFPRWDAFHSVFT